MQDQSFLHISDVLLCEDHPFVQLGQEVVLRRLLPNLKSLRTSALGSDAIRLGSEHKPDLALIDLGLPDMPGTEVIRQLKQKFPNLKIIVITNCDNSALLHEVKSLGVSAIMQKSSSPENLQAVLNRIFSEPSPQDTAVDKSTLEILQQRDSFIEFTPRETEVLQEIVQGKSNQQIAEKMGCALTTVRFHRANILEKTGFRNAAELTAWFIQGQRKRH